MKIKELDWLFLTSNAWYTNSTWYAEVPGGAIIRQDVIEGANTGEIDRLMEGDVEEILPESWGKVTSSSMVFVPSPVHLLKEDK